MKTFYKDPDAVLDYNVNFASWLNTGDTISSTSFAADSGITVDSTSYTDTIATAVVSGGTAGTRYQVVCSIVTSDGLEDDRSFYIRVREK